MFAVSEFSGVLRADASSDIDFSLSLNFIKGEEIFLRAFKRSSVRAIADLFEGGGGGEGVDIFDFFSRVDLYVNSINEHWTFNTFLIH